MVAINGNTTSVDLNPPHTMADIRWATDQGLVFTAPTNRVDTLVAESQWNQWNRDFGRVTFTTATSGTAGSIWLFSDHRDATDSGTAANPANYASSLAASNFFSTDSTDSILIHTNPNLEIHGNVRIVPNHYIDWTPGTILPHDAYSIPAEIYRPGVEFPRLSAEQRAEYKRQRQESRAWKQQSNTAWLRAEQLLRKFLTRDQRRDWVQSGEFFLHVGDRRYRISKGRSGNIALVDGGGAALEKYCCHPEAMVPTCDTLLSQMMMLLHAEAEFHRITNVTFRRQDFPGMKKILGLAA